MRVLEAQQRLKLVQDERDAALKRAQAAEEKVILFLFYTVF